MEKRNITKLAASAMLIVASIALLLGLTFAWFTDTVTSKGNKIDAGAFGVEVTAAPLDPGKQTYTVAGLNGGNPFGFGTPANIEGDTAAPIMSETEWEPGRSNAKLLTVSNNGSLAAKIKLQFEVADGGLENALWFDFIQVDGATVSGSFTKRPMSTLNALADQQEFHVAAGESMSFILAYGMEDSAGNEYQGKSYEATVNIAATQDTVEEDGFGNTQYDAAATYDWNGVPVKPVTPDDQDVYNLSEPAELAWIAQEVYNGNLAGEPIEVELQQDIDLAGIEWVPIGGDNAFSGTFNGNGHTIKNLATSANASSGDPTRGVALFGYAENAVIKDLKFENCSTSGRYAVSAVVGDGCAPLTFENIEVSGTIMSNQDVPNKTAQVAGGILGQGWGSSGSTIVFRNCINRADISVNKWHAGGLWGSITTDGSGRVSTITVENCMNYGSITASAEGYAAGFGGFAVADSCVITGCDNQGTITGGNPTANFVASFNGGKIEGNTQ